MTQPARKLLCAALALALLLCGCAERPPQKPADFIEPLAQTAEQQELLELINAPGRETLLFHYQTEQPYRRVTVWAESYQNGELAEACVAGVALSSDEARPQIGDVAVTIDLAARSFAFNHRAQQGGITSHSAASSLEFSTAALARAKLEDAVEIRPGEEVVLYSMLFAGGDLRTYPLQEFSQHPERLREYDYAYLIKCKLES